MMACETNYMTQSNKVLDMNRQMKGFSLIELLIAIVIISILSAIAIPSYTEYTQRSKRMDAISMLSQLSQAMERYYSVNYTYLDAAIGGADTGAPAATTFGFTQSPADGAAAYNLTISAATATSFSVTATPIGAQANDGCGTLTLTNAGVRTDSGGSKECWR